MGFNWAARPGDHRIVSTGKWRHIFLTADTLTFTVGAGAATTWKVRDYDFNIVAQGSGLSTGATSITLNSSNIVGGAATLPFGWYKLYLERSVAAADPWGLSGGDLAFVRIPTSLILPTRPSVGSSTGNDFAADYSSMGFMRTGPYRHSLYLDAPRYASSKSNGLSDAALEVSTWGTVDTIRPVRPMACFPEDTGGSSPSGTYTSNITSAVTDFIAAGVARFEGRNEPMVTTSAATFVAEEAAFASTVRAAGGTVLGPCPISINGKEFNDWNPGATTGWSWLDQFFAAGGGAHIDEVSFHNYNGGGPGAFGAGVKPIRLGLPYMRYTLDNFVALLTKYGQQNKPRYNTEAFSQFAAHFGANEWRLQAQNTMMEVHLLEQYGVPKERTSIFYPKSHGFWDYPSWLINEGSDATPLPLVAIIRTWSDELAGKGFTTRLDFGTVENSHYIGSRFAAPSGASVVVLQSDGRYGGQVSLEVTGSAGPLVLVDAWGNQSSLTVASNGLATVTVGTLPTYVRLPAGVAAVPAAVNYGIDVVTPRSPYVTTALATPTTFPGATKTVTFPNSTRIDTVIVTTEPVFQTRCGLLDFDVQTFTGGAWVTQATKTVATKTIPWTSHQDGGGGLTDSAYDRSNVFVFNFPDDVTCTAVRVYVRDVTYGGAATVEMSNGSGFSNIVFSQFTGGPTGGTFTYTWNGNTTGTIAYNATAGTIQTALRALPGGGAIVVTGGPMNTSGVTIDFKNALSYRSLTGNPAGLTGGSSPTVAVQASSPNVLNYTGDTSGAGQAGPKVLACEIEAFLSGETDGGGVGAGQPFVVLSG